VHEKELMDQLLVYLRSREDIEIVGPDDSKDRAPIISIVPKNKNIKRVYARLIEQKIMLGMGNFYAVRPLIDMNIPLQPGVIRISFLHYTTSQEVDQLIEALKVALED
jgi:selenocysteine lyase/cysteine desulfurase